MLEPFFCKTLIPCFFINRNKGLIDLTNPHFLTINTLCLS
ncbi:hypothetical protein HMPREF3203_02039 [Proteus mirabilis]|nr:hypothetical protein HMPREF3203_02039 [Proteus mirabilis]